MRGDLMLAILKTIQTVGYITNDVFDTLSYIGYVETYRRMKGLSSLPREHKILFEKTIKKLEEKRRFTKLIHKLQKEGLIILKQNRDRKIWEITKKGFKKMNAIEIAQKYRPNYPIIKSTEIKIVAFDVPEKYKGMREWLRETLKYLKFRMIQKSVWIGNTTLPKEFIDNLNKLKLLTYIEIFAVTKTGTLKKIQ